MKIKLTDFALKHFDPKSSGTKILDTSPLDFEKSINTNFVPFFESAECAHVKVTPGYASFCKLFAVKNFTDARVGSLPITLENYQYIRSGYSARKGDELPVLSRWLELPLGRPKAEWLVLVLYSKEQIDKEAQKDYEKEVEYTQRNNLDMPNEPLPFDADWGIVAILGQSHPNEEPMHPITMIRNAYMHGGSGHPLDEEAYMKAVDFWEHNIIVR